jgi:hypothetical protein
MGVAAERGVNEPPHAGWPWHLTEYEVEYVRAFRVRPVRGHGWQPNQRDEDRLDQEAEGILVGLSRRGRPSRQAREKSRHVRRPIVALALCAVLAGVGLSFALMSLSIFDEVREEQATTDRLK